MTDQQTPPVQASDKPNDEREGPITERIAVQPDEGFVRWLAQMGGSIALSTYRTNRMAFVGWDGKQVTLVMREFDKPMGIATQGQRMAIACRHNIVLLTNSSLLARDFTPDQPGRYDAVYLPRAAFLTGPLNTHDMAFCDDGLWFVNTQFACLSSLSVEYSFLPRWKPHYITQLAPEDRCHLNGMAVRNGKAAFVTAFAATDQQSKWREDKHHSGILMDVAGNEIILRGLCMPHSPRWYEGKLWFLDSGKGDFCVMDPATPGKFDVVCNLPGWTRGLCFVGNYALVGHGRIRDKYRKENGPPVMHRHPRLKCGVSVVDWRTGQTHGCFEFTSGPPEIYDVVYLPHCKRPSVSNLLRPETTQALTTPEFAYWFKAQDEEEKAMMQARAALAQAETRALHGQHLGPVAPGANPAHPV